MTPEKDHRKCLGISKKFSWSRSELLRFNCIIVERSLTELFMIIFLRWWDSNQRAAIYSDTPSASLYHKQARNGCTYMRYVPRHFKDNIVVACTVKFLIILMWMRHIQSHMFNFKNPLFIELYLSQAIGGFTCNTWV